MTTRNQRDRKQTQRITTGQSQEKFDDMSSKISDIHDAIYNPDAGLFARVKNQSHELKLLSDDVKETRTQVDVHKADIDKLKPIILEFSSWKNKMAGTYKWVFLTLATGSTGVFFKLIYDFLKMSIIK